MNNALSTHQQQGLSLSAWDAMRQQAEVLVRSGFLPRDINTPEKAIAVMMTGAELNIPPMQALRQITIIQGKPTVSPELMAALVERDYGSNALIVEESTQERCVVSCLKPGWGKRRSIAFTLLDAQRAKLESETWKKYPVAMLRSRAISIACKTYFQASIGGMYTGEELGANVTIDAEGNTRIVDVAGAPVDDADTRERRMKFLHVVAKEVGLDHDELREKAHEWYGVGSMRELSIDQLGRMIEQLQVLRPVAGPKAVPAAPVPDDPVEATSRVIEDDEDLPEIAALMDEIDAAPTAKEVNVIYKRAIDAGLSQQIHTHYEKRLAELRNGG